jgi:adenylate cyclase
VKAKIFILFLSLCSFSHSSFSQETKIDSLNKILRGAMHDTVRVQTLMALAEEHYLSSPAHAVKDCEEARTLSEKINYADGMSSSYGWLAFLYEQEGDINKALDYNQKGLQIAEKMGFKNNQAAILNNLGAIYKNLGKNDEALMYHHKSLNLRKELNDKTGIATSYNNIGFIYFGQGRIPDALEYYMRALKTQEELKDYDGISTSLGNVASVYREQQEYDKAFEYYRRAFTIQKEQDNKYGMGYALNGIGGLHEDLGNLDSALYYFNQSLQLRTEIKDKQGIAYSQKNMGIVYEKLGKHDEAEQSFRSSLKSFEELKDKMGIAVATNLLGTVLLEKGKQGEAETILNRSLTLAQELGYPVNISNAAGNLQKLYRKENAWKQALLMNDVYIRMRDSVQNDVNRRAAVKTQFKYEFDKKETVLKAEQEKKNAVARAEISKQKIMRNWFVGGFAVVLIFATVFFRQRNKISKEKKRSDELLLNILPQETAEELKATGTAKAKQFDSVTVLFTDFKNFTMVSERLSPQELVNEINYCYSEFDKIISRHGIEKIKTIGDAYMCAAGLPVPNITNAEDCIRAAIEIRDFMKSETRNQKFEIRIGIHTGPVVAGIVGIKKFAYDIWGDTVNIASRMESSGEAGKVNISETTYELVKDKFNCLHRGKIQAKNKGEIDMYFVESAQ